MDRLKSLFLLIAFLLSGACSHEATRAPVNSQVVNLAEKSGICEGVPVKEEVREVSEGIWVAYGYDLANTILIQTSLNPKPFYYKSKCLGIPKASGSGTLGKVFPAPSQL